jgi:DNA primase
MIAKETIDQILEKTDIVAVIGEHVALKKKGRNWLGLCPFHNEKTPSFTVSPEKKLWHCFGCGEGGSAITFLTKSQKISFFEAIEELAGKSGIVIKKDNEKHFVSEPLQKLYQINEETALYYERVLSSKEGLSGWEYLEKRGLSPQTIKKFRLGFAPSGWDEILKELTKKGYAPYLLEKVGLIIAKEKTGYYDRFRERIIFPILDLRNRVVGFGARTIREDVEPKYLNSPETEIYSKGKNLFALNLAKDAVKRTKKIILTEGYMDVITAHEKGFVNAVGILGTALTVYQAKIIHSLCKNIILAFDADEAGQIATLRGIEMLRNDEARVSVMKIIGKDPDEFLRKLGAASFEQALEQALPYLEFKMEAILKKFSLNSPEGKSEAVKEFLSELTNESNQVLRFEYAKKLAERLNLSENLIIDELNRISAQTASPVYKKEMFSKPIEQSHLKAEETLLRMITENKEIREKTKKYMIWDEFTNQFHQEIARVIFDFDEKIEENKDLSLGIMDNLPNDECRKIFSKILLNDEEIVEAEKTFIDCILSVKNWHLAQKKKELQMKINEAQKSGLLEQLKSLTEEFNFCDQLIRKREIRDYLTANLN